MSTDKWHAYGDLKRCGYRHGSVNHSEKEYARGIHHVNTLEGYFAQIKRSIRGTHIHVSGKHMWKYICEFSFRYNMRKEPAAMFDRLIWGLSLPRLEES